VFGIGSFTYNYLTRDTFGFAVKATWGQVNGVGRELFKDPIMDSGVKKSAKGLLRIEESENGLPCLMSKQPNKNKAEHLKPSLKNGKLQYECTLDQIRERLSIA
jgi:nicotinamide phosphoribosyltransferase